MARKRGFLAEMQHQAKLAEQRQRAAVREQAAAVRRAEQAKNAALRSAAAAARASEADRKRLEKEAAAAHVAARQAEVEKLNAQLAATYDAVDSLLDATLAVDDYVDLNDLRRAAKHPRFDREDLRRPIPAPPTLPDPEPPVLQTPESPKGIFGRKRKLAGAHAQAEEEFAQAHALWVEEMQQLPAQRRLIQEEHAAAEQAREEALRIEVDRYKEECAKREKEVAEHNASIDQFITNLSYGAVDAVQEYISIVLANSIYPEGFEVEHEAEFDPENAELALRVLIPAPNAIPSIKSYRYVKASDEITPVALAQKDAKDRYAGVVHQIALRTLHEVFESDRRSLIQTISLEVGTETINPATGRETYVLLAAVGAPKDAFSEVELSGVVPSATLEHFGASVSKNPLALAPANSAGVRRS